LDAERASLTGRPRVRLGIVIPTLDEAEHLPRLLRDLQELRIPKRIVVVDGGSVDGTPALAGAGGARVISAPAGRGGQLQAGVEFLRTPWLLLLHADSRVTPEVCRALEEWLFRADPRQVGYFRFRIEEAGLRWRLLEQGQRLRERAFGLVFGDQGLVVHRSRLSQVGGVPDLPVMEDVELVRRLRRLGPVVAIPAPLATSARRYRREGPVAVLRNTLLLGLHHLGVPAARLSRWYPREPRPQGTRPGERCLLVFARAPVQGRVKTRLAAGIGEEAALEVYRALGRRVVDQVREGPWRTRILLDTPGEEALVAAWLDGGGVEFGPQAEGDLGERMSRAMEWAWRSGAGPVCLIGTDAPDVDQPLVEEAFTALEEGADVVFGPAEDGGYYLVGLRAPAPGLFRGTPWSTDRVLSISLDRCREAQLEVILLRTLMDVDTEEDLLATGLLLRPGRG